MLCNSGIEFFKGISACPDVVNTELRLFAKVFFDRGDIGTKRNITTLPRQGLAHCGRPYTEVSPLVAARLDDQNPQRALCIGTPNASSGFDNVAMADKVEIFKARHKKAYFILKKVACSVIF
jgi:hypothetical protein